MKYGRLFRRPSDFSNSPGEMYLLFIRVLWRDSKSFLKPPVNTQDITVIFLHSTAVQWTPVNGDRFLPWKKIAKLSEINFIEISFIFVD